MRHIWPLITSYFRTMMKKDDVEIGPVDTVQYDSTHCDVVKSGVNSIAAYFEQGNKTEKRSLLLCLDWYLDPYYRHNLPHEDKIFSWLEGEFYKVEDMRVKNDIYELVNYYSDIELRGYEINDRGRFVEKRT